MRSVHFPAALLTLGLLAHYRWPGPMAKSPIRSGSSRSSSPPIPLATKP